MASASVVNIVKRFENPTILPIDGKTTYATIHSLHELLNLNASSVKTNLRFGALGHLCLTLSLTVYATLLAAPVVPPPNPRAAPVIPVGTTGPISASLQYAHNAATVVFNMFQHMDRALHQKLMVAIEDKFLHVLHSPHLGYRGSITLDLLTHLYVIYDVIINAEYLANDKRVCKGYAPTNPTKVIWRHIDDAVTYGDAGSMPYSIKQVIDNIYHLLFNTGEFVADFWEWNKRAVGIKNAPPSQSFFCRRLQGVAPLDSKQDGCPLRSDTQLRHKPGQRVPPPRHGGCYSELGYGHVE